MNEIPSVQHGEVTPLAAPQEAHTASAQASTQPAAQVPNEVLREVPNQALEQPPSPASPATPSMSREACAAELATRFPALFAVVPGEPARPIKLRVHADIQARAPGVFPRAALGAFFARHTTSTAYLKALVAAPHRFDLDGQPAGEIAQEHRDAAVQELARRKEMAIAKRRAQGVGRAHDHATRAPSSAAGAVADEHAPDPERQEAARAHPAPRPSPRFERPKAPQRQTGMPARPGRMDPSDRRDRPDRLGRSEGDRQQRGHAPAQNQAHAVARAVVREVPVVIGDPSQRERAALLHAFQNSPLSKANFCALKRITPHALDQALAQAEQERGARSKAT